MRAQPEQFAHRHGGVDGIRQFITACNSDLSLREIGSLFNISESQACRWRANLCDVVFVPNAETQSYIEFCAHCHERQANEIREFASRLRLIPGGKDA